MKKLLIFVLLLPISLPIYSDEITNDNEPEVNKVRWLPGVEINSIQTISLPQQVLVCVICKTAPHGWGGAHAFIEASPGLVRGSMSLGMNLFFGWGISGIAGKLTVLRTWKNNLFVESDKTYVGPELSVGLLLFDIEVGILRNTSDSNSFRNHVLSLGVGVGL